MSGKCPVCGAPLENGSCGYCGYAEEKAAPQAYEQTASPQPQVAQPQVIINNTSINTPGVIPGISRKNKMVALLLCIFLGGIGAHKFYVGKIGSGILYLLTAGLFGVGWVIDIFLIAVGSFKDEFGLPLRQ